MVRGVPLRASERRSAFRPRRDVGVHEDKEDWLRVGPATIGLALLNAAVFVALTIDSGLERVLGLPHGWSEVLEQPWALASVAFTSAHPLHAALAIAIILSAGGALERRLAWFHVIGIYVATGIGGSAAMATAASAGADGAGISLGASAAFLGLVGALAVMPAAGGMARLALPKVVVVVVALNLLQPLVGAGDWTSSVAHVAGIAIGAGWAHRIKHRAGASGPAAARSS
jgi:membrane associated rhomboid family serine protease